MLNNIKLLGNIIKQTSNCSATLSALTRGGGALATKLLSDCRSMAMTSQIKDWQFILITIWPLWPLKWVQDQKMFQNDFNSVKKSNEKLLDFIDPKKRGKYCMFGTFSCRGGEGRGVKVRMRFLALIIMICPFGGLNSLKWPQINSLAVIAKIFRKK